MLFKLNELEEKKSNSTIDVEVRNTLYLEQHQYMVNSVDKDLDRLPVEGEMIDILSLKSFNAFSLILWVLTHINFIKKIYISTYSLSSAVADGIFRLQQEGKIKEVVLLMSDSLIKRSPVVVDNVMAQAKGNANVKVIFGWNHTKISLTETADHRYLIITGSGNFSKNAQYENYIIRNSEQLFRFYEDWFINFKSKA